MMHSSDVGRAPIRFARFKNAQSRSANDWTPESSMKKLFSTEPLSLIGCRPGKGKITTKRLIQGHHPHPNRREPYQGTQVRNPRSREDGTGIQSLNTPAYASKCASRLSAFAQIISILHKR